MVVNVDHHDQIVIEIGFQPSAHAAVHPRRIERLTNVLCGAGRRRDALDLVQNAHATADDGLLNQFLLARLRGVVGSTRRSE